MQYCARAPYTSDIHMQSHSHFDSVKKSEMPRTHEPAADYTAMTHEQLIEKLKKQKSETNGKDKELKRLRGVVAKLRQEVGEKDKELEGVEGKGPRRRE